jgi:AhpD family alkylhydroperoxidase
MHTHDTNTPPSGIFSFMEERAQLNEIVNKYAGLYIKRFFNIDTQVYSEGVLPKKVKELISLVASLVLRCDDCVSYHIIHCFEEGVTKEELEEALSIALVVGGSITIPHLRKAFKSWDELQMQKAKV